MRTIPMNAVEFREVTKRFKDFYAVKDLSFEVRRGSIFGLLGPNGAGKTTTLRMLVDILAPDSGEILILGSRVSRKIKDQIGYLPEERGLYKEMKVGELLQFFATIRKLEMKEARRRIDEWLSRLELNDWRDNKVSDLSKGMAQKVQFIVAVLHEPELLILDEPFSGFDPVSVKLVKGVIFDLKKRGMTMIFSTHQMEQVEQLCDDICLMNRSTKVLSGELREVKQSFGQNIVIIDFQGSDSFLNNGNVKSVNRFPTYFEVVLKDGGDGQELLTEALAAGARVNRFEIVTPSLNDIFISMVGAAT